MKSNISFNSSLSKFGIGLFETIKITDRPINLDNHIDRLFNSIKELNLDINYDKEFIKKEITEFVIINKLHNKALRLTICDEGYNISIRDIVYDKESYNKGFKLNISPIKRGDSIIYRHKTTNYFENIYTKNYANESGFNDGIFIDSEDNILECSMSNIYFIKDNKIYTPSDKLPLLNGTTKRRIETLCVELNIKIIQSNIKLDEIQKFDFVFVSNALMGVMKVTEISNIKYNENNILFEKIKANINN